MVNLILKLEKVVVANKVIKPMEIDGKIIDCYRVIVLQEDNAMTLSCKKELFEDIELFAEHTFTCSYSEDGKKKSLRIIGLLDV